MTSNQRGQRCRIFDDWTLIQSFTSLQIIASPQGDFSLINILLCLLSSFKMRWSIFFQRFLHSICFRLFILYSATIYKCGIQKDSYCSLLGGRSSWQFKRELPSEQCVNFNKCNINLIKSRKEVCKQKQTTALIDIKNNFSRQSSTWLMIHTLMETPF